MTTIYTYSYCPLPVTPSSSPSRSGYITVRPQVTGSGDTDTGRITKQRINLRDRMIHFVNATDVTHTTRTQARSKEISIKFMGIMPMSRFSATDAPDVIATYELSCSYVFCSRSRDRTVKRVELRCTSLSSHIGSSSRNLSHQNC